MIKQIFLSMMLMISTSVFAKEYKFFTTAAVGSGADIVTRQLAQIVKSQSGINLQVINQSGGGGVIAAKDFKNEKLAVVMTNTSMLIYGPLSGKNEITKTYNVNDFNTISDLGMASSVWFTYPGSGIDNHMDLLRVLPTMKDSSIGVSSQDGMANATAFVKKYNLPVPVVMFKNNNEPVIQVAGKHVKVGVVFMNTESIYEMARNGNIKILGYSGTVPFSFRNFDLAPLAKDLDVPAFYGGSWIAITPGDTEEHTNLKNALTKALQDPDLKVKIRQAWPLGPAVPFKQVLDTATKHQDLFR